MNSVTKPKIRTIIVEDHLVYRIGLKVIIKNDEQIEVIAEASDGLKAISLAQQLKPDVIIMDLSMPLMDGVESTRQIKALLPETKILILTSHENDERVFSALSAGADGYCLKDTSAEMVCTAIKAINDGVGWLDPMIAKKVLTASARVATAPDTRADSCINKFGLTIRQTEILELVVKGMSNNQIADALHISPETIKTHMHNIMDKLAVSDRTQAAVKAVTHGLFKSELDFDH